MRERVCCTGWDRDTTIPAVTGTQAGVTVIERRVIEKQNITPTLNVEFDFEVGYLNVAFLF